MRRMPSLDGDEPFHCFLSGDLGVCGGLTAGSDCAMLALASVSPSMLSYFCQRLESSARALSQELVAVMTVGVV